MTVTDTPAPTFLEIDPRHLQVNPANVRRKTKGLDDLAASIAKIGVQVPLIVKQNGTGDTFVIVAGERRALAAVKADAATVPVIVRRYDDDGQAELTAMMVENLHREDLSPADEAKGYEQLAAFGVSLDEISQLTGRAKGRVESGLKVSTSKTVDQITAKKPLTLEQLAGIVEVEDSQDDVDQLIVCAEEEPEYFDHTLEQLRKERAARAGKQTEIDKLTAAGVKILDKAPGYRFGTSACRLDELVDDKGKKLTTAAHKKCPGHAAFVSMPWHASKPIVAFGCVNPKSNGHKALRAPSSSTSTTAKPKETAAAREKAAKAKAELEELEQQLDAATVVRRKFLKALLARKSPPKGALAFVVRLYADDVYFDDWDSALVEELVGVKNPAKPFVALADTASTDGRLQMVLLAKVVVSIESADLDVTALRSSPYNDGAALVAYLRFLASCGYGLAAVEQKIIDVNTKKA